MIGLNTSSTKEISPLSGGRRLVALACVAGSLVLGAGAAQAAPRTSPADNVAKPVKENVTAIAAKDPETTSSIQQGSDSPNCSRSRQRFFVEGEGWIVRRVTTCY